MELLKQLLDESLDEVNKGNTKPASVTFDNIEKYFGIEEDRGLKKCVNSQKE